LRSTVAILGDLFGTLAPPLAELMLLGGMMVTRAEATQLLRADRSISAAMLALRLTARNLIDRIGHTRGTRLVLGNALVARLLKACLDQGVEVRRGVEVRCLRRETGRIDGVELADRHLVAARRGVVLAGGGFPASASWRVRELPEPVAQHTPAAPGCVGRTIELAIEAGATLGPSGMDNALWFPSSVARRPDGSLAVYPHIVLDRGKPGSIIVDRTGRRFANEAVSYHEFGRAMYRANEMSPSIPAWMICDRRFVARYGLGLIRPRTASLRRYIESGYLIEAGHADELAVRIGAQAQTLCATIERFNGFARNGCDEDFGRGETIYERSSGDPEHGPNPCLGPIGDGPLYAVELHPTPLGTSRGLAADQHARVLDAAGRPIDGLYVCGNDMQSAFGGEYPGAGAQLGQAMTFAWIAAGHAAGRPR
jgi:3-oxosteroid 1-dehydrogenase